MFSSVKRIERRQTQMLHVAREGGAPRTADSIAVADLIKQAWQEALHHLGGESAKSAKLKKPDGEKSVLTRCDAASLKFALMEIILNGLQAGGANPVVSIQMQSSGAQTLELTVVDNGPGFAPEAAKSAGNPFYTTKVVGLGLGLFVARRIVEAHGGKLLVAPAEPGQPGRVQVSLPVEAALVAGARVSVPLESAKH
jgi:signal transduction histidine kinase